MPRTTPPSNIHFKLEGIGNILLNNYLSVPPYQRSYAWEEKHVVDLLQDVTDAMSKDEDEYFLGTIVTRSSGERPEVVDGQQRLATVSILLAGIRNYFHNQQDKDRVPMLDEFLFKKDLSTLDVKAKLVLNGSDNDFFLKRVLSLSEGELPDNKPSKESHQRIITAIDKVASHVESLIGAHKKDPTAVLTKLVEYIRNNVKVILIEVPDDTNAFAIFETLNDRGLTLALTDLLKNFLFSKVRERLEEVRQNWISMCSILEAVDDEDVIVTFIRHYWSSVNGLVRERELYSKIKDQIHNKQKAVDFVATLLSSAKTYSGIINTDNDFWDKFGESTRQDMGTLNLLGMIQIRPLLLSVLEKFPVIEVNKAFKLFVSWAVRLLISGKLGSGPLESQYSVCAKKVRESSIVNARQLMKEMIAIVPTDDEFKEVFSRATVTKVPIARYYLRRMEETVSGHDTVPNPNQDIVNLEHVLPQNPSEHWSGIPVEIANSYYRRIGNLALLNAKINQSLGNDSFATKKIFYKGSPFSLTRRIANETCWGQVEIEKRQKELADIAVKAWPGNLS